MIKFGCFSFCFQIFSGAGYYLEVILFVCVMLSRPDLDKRRAEKQRLEEQRRRENMDRLRKDMEKSRGETVVLNTGLKDRDEKATSLVDNEDLEEEGDDVNFDRFSEDEDAFDEDEDEQVASFSL